MGEEAMAKKDPIDPLDGPKLVLAGRIVTMNAAFAVIPNGRLYIDQGSIVAVADAAAPPPAGFQGVRAIDTKGTIYPGLIELHNHLAYNALRLWQVPKKYTNRDQWAGIPDYRKLISGPMQIVGKTPDLLPALIRYVEAKCLIAGVTTSQGIQLFSNAGVRRFYKGIVRNVEQTDDAGLPEALTKIADVEATNAKAFLARLQRTTCLLLHLSEGRDTAARNHFRALEIGPDEWAITPALAGIHCAALETTDFQVLGKFGGAMVWSPLSNLLLYGDTADVKSAVASGVRIGIGSDWSPSGSKNLLGELKAAKIWCDRHGILSDRDIVAMATTNGANILGWSKLLGSLEPGKRADLVVIAGTAGDPYATLIEAKETAVALVAINGIPRYGTAKLMGKFGVDTESVTIGGSKRKLYLEQKTQDPLVGATSLADAAARLTEALKDLPKLALALEKPKPAAALSRGAPALEWQLALDELQETGCDLRHHLALRGKRAPTGAGRTLAAAAAPLSGIVQPLVLDPLSVADDDCFLDLLRTEKNLPNDVRATLVAMYG
jgi:5-methylthioadenosine/S-adenosylhomocysteine deaminase